MTSFAKYNIIYIREILSLNRKKFNKYIFNYKKYFITTIKKLKSKIIDLIVYIYRINKRLRD